MAAMQAAINANVDLAKIEKMMELQAKWDAMEAKKAYTIAMAEFKKNPPVIIKDKKNNQYNSMYTTIGNLVNTVLPKMSECGLSHRWEIVQNDKQIIISCIVTHEKGHSETTTMMAPPDNSGSKNAIQQIKSTRTYLQAATFESALGLASTDANVDDDGNAAGNNIVYLTEEQRSKLVDAIADVGVNSVEFLKWLGYESIETIEEKDYNRAISGLKQKKSAKQKKEGAK